MLFEATAFANMNEETLRQYNAIMTTELDIIARREFARKEGLAEGRAEGRAEGLAEGRVEGRVEASREIALNLIQLGYSDEIIAQATGLSRESILELKTKE